MALYLFYSEKVQFSEFTHGFYSHQVVCFSTSYTLAINQLSSVTPTRNASHGNIQISKMLTITHFDGFLFLLLRLMFFLLLWLVFPQFLLYRQQYLQI